METPDRTGREAILKVHVTKKELPLADDVNLSDIASMTTGFTGYFEFPFYHFMRRVSSSWILIVCDLMV